MQKFWGVVVGIVATATLLCSVGCKKEGAAGQVRGKVTEKILVKFGSASGENDTQTLALQEVAKRLNAAGTGFDVTVFSNSSLGGIDDLTEQAMQGAAIVTVSDPGRLSSSFVYDYGVIQMPYMFKDYTLLDKLLETASYKDWEREFDALGIKLITSNWFSGTRHFVTNKEINTPDDLKGLRIRTIGSKLFTESVRALGATPVAMEWAEVRSAIGQSLLDGTEIQSTSSYDSNLYEVARYTNKTGHFQLIGSVIAGSKFFESLSSENQELFVKTFREVGSEYQKKAGELAAQYEKEMADQYGMTIHEVNTALFEAAVQPLYQLLEYSALRQRLQTELNN